MRYSAASDVMPPRRPLRHAMVLPTMSRRKHQRRLEEH
jgi:hypothetical protein